MYYKIQTGNRESSPIKVYRVNYTWHNTSVALGIIHLSKPQVTKRFLSLITITNILQGRVYKS